MKMDVNVNDCLLLCLCWSQSKHHVKTKVLLVIIFVIAKCVCVCVCVCTVYSVYNPTCSVNEVSLLCTQGHLYTKPLIHNSPSFTLFPCSLHNLSFSPPFLTDSLGRTGLSACVWESFVIIPNSLHKE